MLFPTSPARRLLPIVLLAALGRPDCVLGASPGWVDLRVSGPFVCRSEFPLAPWEGLLRELAELQEDLVCRLEIPPVAEPIELYLFCDKSSYDRYLRQNLPGIPYRRALYIKSRGPGRVYAYRSQELRTDVRHECTHALLHAVLPLVPLWLDEGLAEYFEVPLQQQAFDNPHRDSLRWSLQFGSVRRLEDLERAGNLSDMGRNEYRDAWAWVHFMLHGPRQANAELIGYLRDIRSGVPPGLLSDRLKRQLGAPDRYLAGHFKQWKR